MKRAYKSFDAEYTATVVCIGYAKYVGIDPYCVSCVETLRSYGTGTIR